MSRSWVMATAALLVASAAGAQEKSVGRDLEAAFKDVLWVWSSPVRAETSDLEGAGLVLGVSGLALLGDEAVYRWLKEHPDMLPVRFLSNFRETSPINLIGRTKILQPLSVGLYLAGWILDEPDLRAAGIGCSATNLSNTLARHVMALLLGRQRPMMENGAWEFEPLAFGDWEYRSFPGGHAANAVTCISFWNHRFDLGAAEPLLYMLGGLVGSARILDDAHWPSDTAFGIGFGISVGKGVASRQLGRRAGDPEPIVRLGLTVRF